MHQGRSGTDAQKTITQRLETVGTKWIAGVRRTVRSNFLLETILMMLEGLITASLLTSRRCFGRFFAELIKEEDQQLAWSGFEEGGSKQIK